MSHDVVLFEVFGLLKHESTCSLSPLKHETMVFECRDSIRIPVEA